MRWVGHYPGSVSPARHHTVSRFLLGRFAQEGPSGRRVCQLEVGTGRPRQVSPRDATVAKHFYSIDIADGERSTVVEEVLGLIENVAAPLVAGLADGDDVPTGEKRAELALYIAMSKLRTPLWR